MDRNDNAYRVIGATWRRPSGMPAALVLSGANQPRTFTTASSRAEPNPAGA